MIIFNGIDLEEYIIITDIKGRGLASYDINTVKALHLNGERFAGKRKPMREISVEFTLPAEDAEEVRLLLDVLNSVFAVDEPVPIKFKDEPTMTYYGIPEGASDKRDFVRFHQGTITFLCPDPYKYGPERIEGFTAGSAIITNSGSAPSDPIFELTVTNPTTHAIVSNGNDEYNLIGIPADDDVQVVDTRSTEYSMGPSMAGWSTAGTQIDSVSGRITNGTMVHDGTGIVANNYGTPPSDANAHGPSIIRELPEAIQDFELEAIFDTRTDYLEENFRIEVYLFDEFMTMQGKIGIRDRFNNKHNRSGLARIGPYVDATTRYLAGSSSYDHDNFGKSSMFFFRWKREGPRTDFYIAQVVKGKHQNILRRSYTDKNGEWLGKVKYVQIYIRSWKGRRAPYLARVNKLDIHKLSQATEDQTPYIAYAGDVITFDHVRDEILVNGEERSDLKDFGGTFFKLQQGENAITTLPEDSIAAQVTFRDKYH